MKFFITISFLLLSIQNISHAADERWIELEWDEVPGAVSYEVSLSQIIDAETLDRGVFPSENARWSKPVNPGIYIVKIRTIDNRKAPGVWGEPIPVTIRAEDPQQLLPLENFEVLKNESGKTIVNFQWAKVVGVNEYLISVYDNKDKKLFSKKTFETDFSYELNEISDYSWSVTSVMDEKDKDSTDEIKRRKFSIRGEKLKSPVIEANFKNPKGVVFKWQEVYRAEDYEISISKTSDTKDDLISKSSTSKNVFALPLGQFPKGRWVFSVVAKSKKYKNSDNSRIILNTEDGKTTIISNDSILKESGHRDTNSSMLGMRMSYPTLKYKNTNFETDTSNYQTLKGIQFSANHSLSLFDTYNLNSHLSIGQFADSYVDIVNYEVSSGVRKVWSSDRLKFQSGLSIGMRSRPLLSANRLISNNVDSSDFIVIYPELNFQFNYKIDEKVEIELFIKGDLNFLSVKSPDDRELSKSFNKFYGLKGLYNINQNFSLSAGLNVLDLSNKVLSKTGGSSFAIAGDVNESKINATYLDFGVEYFY